MLLKILSTWLVGWWAAFEVTPLDLQFVGGYYLGHLCGMVGQLSRIYMTYFSETLTYLVD